MRAEVVPAASLKIGEYVLIHAGEWSDVGGGSSHILEAAEVVWIRQEGLPVEVTVRTVDSNGRHNHVFLMDPFQMVPVLREEPRET